MIFEIIYGTLTFGVIVLTLFTVFEDPYKGTGFIRKKKKNWYFDGFGIPCDFYYEKKHIKDFGFNKTLYNQTLEDIKTLNIFKNGQQPLYSSEALSWNSKKKKKFREKFTSFIELGYDNGYNGECSEMSNK